MQTVTPVPDWAGLVAAIIVLINAVTIALVAWNNRKVGQVKSLMTRQVENLERHGVVIAKSALPPTNEPPTVQGDTQPLSKQLPLP